MISTDPAHNVSDAFDQKFAKDPVKVKNFENLWCMEIDPSANEGSGSGFFGGLTGEHGMEETEEGAESTSFMKELFQSVPGIDEATAFGAVMRNLDDYNFDLIIFDTAPTGHTLRLLNFPSILEKGLLKLMELKDKFGGMMGQVSGMMGGGVDPEAMQKSIFEKLDGYKTKIDEINNQFKDAEKTTFIAVCIPEFLSMYETERLAIELAKQEIDIHNIVINQVLFPEPAQACKKCFARRKMQEKYLTQIHEIYDDFNLTVVPQLDNEVRGMDLLKEFGGLLFNHYVPEWEKEKKQE